MRAKIILMALAALLIAATMARAQLSMMGIGPAGDGTVASCPSPTAPNGVVDLSVCSNAYYVALIF